MELTPFIKKYYNFQTQYENKYGINTVVFIEKGKFYECYEGDNDEGEKNIGKAKSVGNILGITITKTNNEKPSTLNNPYMIGVPTYAIDRHLPKLTDKYTIIIVNQKDIPNSKKKDHIVSKILSPGTMINEIKATNYICFVTTKSQKSLLHNKIITYETIIFIDVSIGKIIIYDFQSIDTCEYKKLLSIYNPSEIISDIKLDIHIETLVHEINIDPVYNKLEYQATFLNKIYKSPNKNINIIEYIGLNKYTHILPYLITILQFIYDHDVLSIKNLNIPIIMNNNNKLNIDSNLIYQLNLISNNNLTMYTESKFNSLFSVINNTKTKMGYRLLYDRLLFPINDVNELNSRYDKIGKYTDIKELKEYRKILSNIIDIEKKHRKIFIGTINPYELSDLISNYNYIIELFDKSKIDVTEFKNYINEFDIFDIDILKQYSLSNIEKSFFKKGLVTELDKLEKSIKHLNSFFNKTAERLSLEINPNKSDLVKVLYKDGYYLTCTKPRWEILKNKIVNVHNIEIKDLQCISTLKSLRITNDIITEKSELLTQKYEELHNLIKDLYLKKLEEISLKYKQCMKDIVFLISEFDVVISCAYTSKKYGYVKPIINNKFKDSSYLNVKNIRHPIIERNNINNQYIGNDVSLINNGMLIYGINAAGKSSLLRSIGCSLILAHMGMYVPCNEFEFYPFNCIMTKLMITDNLFKYQSTFICEMLELKDMIDKCSENSILLCDELCSSTETSSGISILAASINQFIKKRTNFVLTSHLHSLLKLNDIDQFIKVKLLKVYSFSVTVTGSTFNYGRKLIEGSGDSQYGLEIANGLNFNSTFISDSFKYRKEIDTGNKQSNLLIPTKTSRYNSNVFIDSCFKCGETKNLHTHHIQEQHKAKDGFIDEIKNNKNVKYNLLVLCESCHKEIHKESNL